MSIPKIIHQLWVGPKPAPLHLMNTWKESHPDYKYMFWNEDTIAEHFPDGLYNQKQYDAMPEWNGSVILLDMKSSKSLVGSFSMQTVCASDHLMTIF